MPKADELKEAKKRLKEYIEIDNKYEKDGDFGEFCNQHCNDILNILQALEHLLQEYKELQANWDTLKDYVEDEFSNIPQGDQEEEQWLMMIDKIKELESEEVN